MLDNLLQLLPILCATIVQIAKIGLWLPMPPVFSPLAASETQATNWVNVVGLLDHEAGKFQRSKAGCGPTAKPTGKPPRKNAKHKP